MNPGITSGVVNIFSTYYAFALSKVWGHTSYGGTDPGITSGVVNIFSTTRAFAALKVDGSVKAWGDAYLLYLETEETIHRTLERVR